MKIELTSIQAELIYFALSKAQDSLTDEATDEEWQAYEELMNLVSGR